MTAAQRQKPKEKSMLGQKIAVNIALMQKNEKLWSAAVVFLGALFLLGAVPFYPVYLVPLLALVCGLVCYFSRPPFGTLLSLLLAFPAVIYQSSVFGWLFLLILVVAMFEVFEHWLVISVLQVLIAAPFSFGAVPIFGWITIAGMVMAALYFGSKKSILISVPSVLIILLLSSIWTVENSAFMPLNLSLYTGISEMMFSKSPADIGSLGSEFANALGNFFSPANIELFFASMSWTLGNLITILISDSGLVQLIAWAFVLFVISYASGKIDNRPQLVSSLALLIVIPFYYVAGIISGTGFSIEFLGVVVFSIIFLGAIEQAGIKITRESKLRRKERLKAYGKFGMADIGVEGAETLDDVGNYTDVKDELRESIIMPLQKKEIAYTYGIKPPSGVLLFGPPGTGKTMLMRALAHDMKYNFIEVKCSQILSQWYGESLPYNEKILFERNGKVELVEIGKIVEEKLDGNVLSFDEKGKVRYSKIKKHIKHKCTSKIVEVRTRTGRKIRVTDYHSLFAFNGKKIESIPTSELEAGKSYIAIPSKICRPEVEINEIDVLHEFRENDHGLFIRNTKTVVEKAIEKLGEKKVLNLLGFTKHYLKDAIIKRNVGIRASKLYSLLKKADINYRNENLVFSGKREIPVIIKMDEEFAEFIGLWVAEGSYNRKDTVRLSVSDAEIDYINDLCTSLFGQVTVYKKENGKGRDIYIGSRALYVLLKEVLGLNHGADKKKMPGIVFNLSEKNLKALLRGYFSGDGTVYPNQHGVPTVEVLTASRHLADQLAYLLLYFNLVAKIYNKREWNGTETKRICFTGHHYLNLFAQHIGFNAQHKNDKIQKYLNNVSWHRSEQIPVIGELKNTVVSSIPKNSMSATIGKDILMELEDVPEFMGQLNNDMCLDRVEKITEVEPEEWVYDVSVDPCQNFVGGFGGIFAHNSEKNLAEVFSNARKTAPTILFFDEIDALGKKRSSAGTDEVTPRVLTTLLQEMDGAVKSKSNVIVIGATNVPNKLDPALLRPGRFDKIIYMHLPDEEGRKKIFEVSFGNTPFAEDIDLDLLARKTQRFSGADIKNVAVEAKRLAAKRASQEGKVVPVTMSDLLRVISSVKPSVGLAQLDEYEQFRMDFERRTGAEEKKKPREKEVSWEDVAGLKEVKKALLEAIEMPLLHEDLMKQYKVRPSKGILLYGPPGTGKTLIAKAASSELNASFQSLSGADLMKRGYLQAVNVLRELFNRARENTPAIIFLDEVDTFAPSRGRGGATEITGQLLNEMDGMKKTKGVVVIAATNRPEVLDPAIMRPGRFDKIFYIPPPDTETRKKVFEIHLGEFAAGVDLSKLAEMTPHFTGADIASICQEAKMMALRAKIAGKKKAITTEMVAAIIERRKPSVTPQMVKAYEAFASTKEGVVKKKKEGGMYG